MKLHEIKPNPDFKLLDITPERPFTPDEIDAAMSELHARVHHQAHHYGGKWDHKKKRFDNSEHRFFQAVIATPHLKEDISPAEQQRRKELYARWRKLVNMSASSLEKWLDRQLELAKKDPSKHPGMKQSTASKMGISTGRQSAKWIIKMKSTPVKDWTPEMWRWAGKQVSFISRMKGAAGPLKDENGEPTRKLLSLKVWGHNPLREDVTGEP